MLHSRLLTSPKRPLSLTGLLAAAVLLGGCAGSGTIRSDEQNRISSSIRSEDTHPNDVRDQLIFEVDRWLGTRYRYGGTGGSGFDCSGFVRRVYQDAFGEDLPRTTREQMKAGSAVRRSELQLADLVFFRTPARTDHVGVYLGNGEFAHASTSSGVMISHLGERYWNESYRSARRVLAIPHMSREREQHDVEPLERTVELARASRLAGRIGW